MSPPWVIGFAPNLVAWQRAHGRHGLPWQGTTDPYRVWLSEVMLQQTQVVTVLGFFERFLAHFPDVVALGNAPQSQVFALWSGLGYYSRARNLHACAQRVRDDFSGQFPRTQLELQQLPGIGPSTAAAIASFCFGERVSIFDGNVKRVLARLVGFEGDVSSHAASRPLNVLAQELVQQVAVVTDLPNYTQGLMDLGATLCTPRKPACSVCPMRADCTAHARGREADYPIKRRKIKRSAERWRIRVLYRIGSTGSVEFWLVQRPATGIWASLYVPLIDILDFEQATKPIEDSSEPDSDLIAFKHVLTHKDLFWEPSIRQLGRSDEACGEGGQWVAATELARLGLPSAVNRILEEAIGFVGAATMSSPAR